MSEVNDMETITQGFQAERNEHNKEAVNKNICEFYREMTMPDPGIIWFDSVTAVEYLLGLKRDYSPRRLPDRQNVFFQIHDIEPPKKFWQNLSEPIKILRTWTAPHDANYAQLGQLISMLYSEVYKIPELNSKMWLNGSLLSLMPVSKGTECIPKQFDISWIMKFDSFVERLNFINQNCFCWYPFGEYVLAVKFPLSIKINGRGQLHCDAGPATTWEDGTTTWHLNGVFVPHWIVETPAEEINSQSVLEESDTMIRREIIRKIGVEKFVNDMDAVCIEDTSAYELLEIKPLFAVDRRPGNKTFGQWPIQKYLKMQNPSSGDYHIEGVPPDCCSIKEALAWRNQTDETPQYLT